MTAEDEQVSQHGESPETVGFSAPLEGAEGGVDLLIPEDVIDEFGLSEGEEITVEFVRGGDDDE